MLNCDQELSPIAQSSATGLIEHPQITPKPWNCLALSAMDGTLGIGHLMARNGANPRSGVTTWHDLEPERAYKGV